MSVAALQYQRTLCATMNGVPIGSTYRLIQVYF